LLSFPRKRESRNDIIKMEKDRKDFILEIGTEELPASVVKGVPFYALKCVDKELSREQHVYVTPRRIIIYFKEMVFSYNKLYEGPPKKIAYDANGKPTKALLGFLKKINATEKSISKVPQKDNEKIGVQLKLFVDGAINAYVINFVKSLESFQAMTWDNSGVRFSRPIRWILALHGNKVMPIKIGGLEADNVTYGNRLSLDPIKIKNPEDYFKKLKKNNIFYDFLERRAIIEKYLNKNNWHKNPQLLDEVAGLIEHPTFIKGSYNKAYLKLPREVLTASMSKNQRIFPTEDKKGNFGNKFIAVTNGNTKGLIKRHYEQVLDAKLKDALFFYGEDIKKPLSARAKELNGIVFHKKLGSYADKIERLKNIISYFKDTFKLDNFQQEKIIKASLLCKADLLTQMVGEFPSLQGVMGKYYALKEGIGAEIAEAIEEHYHPRFSADTLPKSKLGRVLALIDKFDSLISHFKAGHQPKGNRDPYALRRQSIGLINIILKSEIEVSVSGMFDKIFELIPGDADKDKLRCEFMEFIKERLIVVMKSDYEFKHDLIEAVLSSGFDNLYKFFLRLKALSNIINEFYFEQARCVVERTNNITRNVSGLVGETDASLFEEEQEGALHKIYKGIRDKIISLIAQSKYDEATKLYGESLAQVTSKFFDKVMVNVDDERLKNNRLKLLKEINSLYANNIADLSVIPAQAGIHKGHRSPPSRG